MLTAILSGFVLALLAPWVHRIARGATGWVLALLPLGLAAFFASHAGAVAAGAPVTARVAWVPGLGIELAFRLDGLGLLFAVVVAFVGALILVYAGGYLARDAQLGRLYAYLLLFMASMLGVVLADNAIALFVFWELTSLSSYLLIGFDHERQAARAAALQALLVTGLGGLALLAGLLLLGHAGGSLDLSVLAGRGDAVRAHGLYPAILALVLAGAFTKSAQAPFHFWLPNAMEAPTPVSAYLHSATMVQAGVYLLARLHPVLGGTVPWYGTLVAVGATTFLVGACLALKERHLKRVLAQSTVAALGMLTLLLGIGTERAAVAAVVLFLAHALFKAALFLVAGAIDHATGEKDVERLGGLGRRMPVTAAAGVLAALAMAGLPPALGFIAKEGFFEAVLAAPRGAAPLAAVAALASALAFAAAALAGIKPFLGSGATASRPAHEAPLALVLGPAVLAAAVLGLGLAPGPVGRMLVAPAAAAVVGGGPPVDVRLALWHGAGLPLAVSAASLAAGILVYAGRGSLRRIGEALAPLARLGPARAYGVLLATLGVVAAAQTRLLQSGSLHRYVVVVVASAAGLVGYTFARGDGFALPGPPDDIRFQEAALAALIVSGALAAVLTRSRLGAVVALGAVGYGVALFFVLLGAPDLAMTQFLIETLTVILFVLVLHHLPPIAVRAGGRAGRARDLVVAGAAGALVTGLILAVNGTRRLPSISPWFGERSVPDGQGRNVVNVILVDFRALDTLGEITVLAAAGVGVYALLKLAPGRAGRRGRPDGADAGARPDGKEGES